MVYSHHVYSFDLENEKLKAVAVAFGVSLVLDHR